MSVGMMPKRHDAVDGQALAIGLSQVATSPDSLTTPTR